MSTPNQRARRCALIRAHGVHSHQVTTHDHKAIMVEKFNKRGMIDVKDHPAYQALKDETLVCSACEVAQGATYIDEMSGASISCEYDYCKNHAMSMGMLAVAVMNVHR